MLKRNTYVIFIIVFLVLFSGTVSAAEIKGRMWVKGKEIPDGAFVEVVCGNTPAKKARIPKNGRYSLRHLPSNQSCNLTVHFPNAKSAGTSLSTRRSVVTFNAELKVVKNSLLVFPQ